ncbi:MAG: hypothetical protein MJZ93_04625 [Paludibacteraceae bacterium]|nr:hypothetical protein [Paludibacteraceae bacterium]
MKKLLAIFAAMLLLVACKTTVKEPETPGKTPENGEEYIFIDESSFLAAQYWGQDAMSGIEGDQVEVDMQFKYVAQDGSGFAAKVKFVTESVDEKFFPKPGTYALDSTLDAGTLIYGYDPLEGTADEGSYIQGSLIFDIQDGALVSYDFVTGGYAEVKGSADAAEITFHLISRRGDVLNFVYKGALVIQDYEKKEADRYTQEPQTPTEINITSNECLVENYADEPDVFSLLLIDSEDTERIVKVMCNKVNSGTMIGSYTVSETVSDFGPGTVRHSYGLYNNECYPSFMAYYAGEAIYGYREIYFITGGSMSITEGITEDEIKVDGQFTTYYGTKLNVTYTGVPIVKQ